MNNYLLLAVCFLLGMALRRSGRLPDNAAAALNGFIVHISLPALTLSYVHDLELDSGLILPALILLLFAGLFGAEGQAMRVTVFEAAMAPMFGASTVAMDHALDPPLLTLIVGIGIPLSFLTLPAWWWLLNLV